MHGTQSVTSAPPLFCLSHLSDKFRGLHAKKATKQVSTSKDEARGIQQASQRVQRKKMMARGTFEFSGWVRGRLSQKQTVGGNPAKGAETAKPG